MRRWRGSRVLVVAGGLAASRVKRYLSALLIRALPTAQPPAFVSDAGKSVRRAWAAVSASVTEYLPAELPRLPRLPALSLPKFNLPQLSLPQITLPQVPAISPPLGRFFSSLTTLMFAPGQIHGLAIYYQVATRNLVCDPDAGPRVEWVDDVGAPLVAEQVPKGPVTIAGVPPSQIAVTMTRGLPVARRWFVPATAVLPPASAALPVVEFLEQTGLGPSMDSASGHWVDLAAQGVRVRGQRPPPCAAANLA